MINNDLEFDKDTQTLLAFYEDKEVIVRVCEKMDISGYKYVNTKKYGRIKMNPEDFKKLIAKDIQVEAI